MPGESRIGILAPGVVRDSPLPRRWRKRGAFRKLSELGEAALLARAFGVEESDLALAPLHYLGMTGSDPDGYCLFAYPVHLHARREQLILMTGGDFEVSDDEASDLIALIQKYYPQWRLERTGDAMWFIITGDTPDIETTALGTVLGQDINDHLPRGADAMAWLSTMNELQMIMFDSRTNQEREAAGRPAVNSLWFWGGGCLSEIRVEGWRRVATNDPVALGIGRKAGIATSWLGKPPDTEADLTEAGTLWVYAGAGRDEGGGFPSSAHWDALGRALRRGDIDRLQLFDPGFGELTIESRHTRSWLPWR